jgi:ABC-type glycerol-3-phosphate transport system substrate-binding protein
MKRTLATTLALAMTFLLGACSGGEPSKAGGGAAPLTLRIGTDDGTGVPAADQIEEFVRQVKALSDGQIVVEPVWHAEGSGQGSGGRPHGRQR